MTGKNDSMAMLGWKIPLTLLIWSVIVIGACSDTSPLYSFYPSPDPSIFFMFGRGLLHGLLPYVEMADSKGPLLVWIYYAAAWIDRNIPHSVRNPFYDASAGLRDGAFLSVTTRQPAGFHAVVPVSV